MVSKSTQKIYECRVRRVVDAFGEDAINWLAEKHYKLVHRKLGWAESTYRSFLGQLGRDTGDLKTGTRTYMASDEDVEAIKKYVDWDLGVTLAVTGCRFGELWRMVIQRDTLIIYPFKGGTIIRQNLDGLGTEHRLSITNWVVSGHMNLSYTAAVKRLYRARERGLLPKDCTAHTLRHRAATVAIESGVDIDTVAAYLGHRSTETTRRYTNPRTLGRIGDKLAGRVD